ncbi:hypothetical protein JCM31271_15250 [Halorubrum trueperi]
MSNTEWRPTAEDDGPDENLGFGDALTELAVENAPDIDPVNAGRESREDTSHRGSLVEAIFYALKRRFDET